MMRLARIANCITAHDKEKSLMLKLQYFNTNAGETHQQLATSNLQIGQQHQIKTAINQKCVQNSEATYLTLTKSRLQSLAFEPNCHLHCVSALYSCPGSCSGYLYCPICLGSSTRQDAWAVLVNTAHHSCQSERRQQKKPDQI